MIRVVIAENSAADRALLVGVLTQDAGIQIIGQASNGAEAVSMTKRLRPQVVTMGRLDRSPHASARVDELDATRLIMADAPTPIVVLLSTGDTGSEQEATQLLAAGAVAVLRRPSQRDERDEKELIDTVRAMAEVKVVGHRLRKVQKPSREVAHGSSVGVIAIAASTGGPNALARVLKPLPRDMPVPIVIVQHLASGFVPGFARWLDEHCAIEVKLVEHTERLRPGVAYLAADGAHLKVSRVPEHAHSSGLHPPYSLYLEEGPSHEGFCPSASVLFDSVAEAFGPQALAVILTGMGRDGVSGLRQVRARGGTVIAQDRHTSVVFGMPSMAIEAGLADDVLPIDSIARRLLDLVCAKEQR